MEQSNEKQPAEEQEDQQRQKVIEEVPDQMELQEELIEQILEVEQRVLVPEIDEEPTEENVLKKVEEIIGDPEKEDQDSGLDKKESEGETAEVQQFEKDDRKIQENLDDETVAEEDIVKEESEILENISKLADQPEEHSKDKLKEKTQEEEQLPSNLDEEATLDVPQNDDFSKVNENLTETSENKEQLTENLEDLEAESIDADLVGDQQDCATVTFSDPNAETQNELSQEENKENPDRIEQQRDNSEEQEEDASKPEEDLPNEQVTQFLRNLVSQLWPELGANPELRLKRASAKGDNYLGVVWRLQVASESNRSLVVKLPPQNRVRRKQFFARPCFLRETVAYEVFLPLVNMIQGKWQIAEEDRFRQHALCHGTRQDEPNECIVLEDLSCAGFTLHDRFQELSVDHVRRVICTYAKLHATSLAAKHQLPERMEKLQQLVDIFEQRREDHALGVYFENLKGSALSSLLSPEDDPYRVRLEAYFAKGTYFELLLPLVSGSNCEPFAVICHGDCWNNNILYKIGDQGELEDVRLIDWQLMRYASPVTDLAYFLFTCTSREFRQQHLKNMLEDYYEELGLQLNRLNEKLEELFPRPAFDVQVATKAAVGLLLAMMVLPIVTMQGSDVPDLQAISERIEAGATTDLQGAGFLGAGNEATFKQRMREVILDCVDFDYI
ncbi:uncharacterized protein LOC108109995 [Drosophila eugracilis]|uniref:uncharacterized protein LOC108109995 n=1 Tax=Drosophila eugracilis TaxID=29029 RepID=UPI0007E66144|nr:uncharacterized protein LOC108109995 [Drosophila eugracilis]